MQFIRAIKAVGNLCSVATQVWISFCLTQGTVNTTILVHLLDDNVPEEKEVYQVILYDVRTQGSSEFKFELSLLLSF